MQKKDGRRTTAACLLLTTACLLVPLLAKAQMKENGGCANGLATCFLPANGPSPSPTDTSDYLGVMPTPTPIVNMYVRTLHGGPLAHHWIELESSNGPVTVGFGPATLPFIDAGQISIWYSHGKVEKRGAIRLFAMGFNYAKPPG